MRSTSAGIARLVVPKAISFDIRVGNRYQSDQVQVDLAIFPSGSKPVWEKDINSINLDYVHNWVFHYIVWVQNMSLYSVRNYLLGFRRSQNLMCWGKKRTFP